MNFAVLFLIINLLFFGAVAYYFLNIKKEIGHDREDALSDIKIHDEKIKKDEKRIDEEFTEVKRKATLILSESEKIAQELILELEKSLGKHGGEAQLILPEGSHMEEELGSLSVKIKSQYVGRIKNLLHSLEKFEIHEAQKVSEFAEEQEITTDRNLQKLRIEQLNKMHLRIEDYKREELLLFDQKVKRLIDEVAQKVLGHALTVTEHRELIMEALEKAKKDNLI